MPESKAAEDKPFVWMDVGHVNVLPDGTLVQKGQVAVDPDSGTVLDPQPVYPDQPEEPPPSEPAPKATGTTTKGA
jgi:hypothetical protein